MSEVTITEVERISLQPHDVVLFRAETRLAQAVHREIREKLQEIFPDNRVIVIEQGSDLLVISPEEADALEATIPDKET